MSVSVVSPSSPQPPAPNKMPNREGRRSSIVKLFADPPPTIVAPIIEEQTKSNKRNGLRRAGRKFAPYSVSFQDFPLSSMEDKAANNRNELALRYTSLALMICQYVCQVLFTRFAVIRAANDHRQPTFLKTVAIVLKELLEAFVSFLLFLVFTKSNKSSLLTIMETLKNAPMFLPALAYTVKNFLIFVAIDHLDAATFTVTYQLKILTTALFLVLMLNRRLSLIQWLSLCVLCGGVVLVELSAKWTEMASKEEIEQHKFPSLPNLTDHSDATTLLPTSPLRSHYTLPAHPSGSQQIMPNFHENFWVGISAVLGACIFSGYAGVYLEKVVKQPGDSLWLRNFQLCFLSTLIASGLSLLKDLDQLLVHGPFVGFDWLVWAVVFVQVLGGLLVAMVVRYGDNILKAFANSLAILGISILSTLLFGTTLDWMFAVGTSFVVGSMLLYSVFPPREMQTEQQDNQQIGAAGK